MNYTSKSQIKNHSNDRFVCCGAILLRNERISGYCFKDYREIPYQKRMALREARGART